MLTPTRILVPTDFSEYSGKALAQGLDIAQQYQAKVFLVHVVHHEIHHSRLVSTFSEEEVQQWKDGALASAKLNLQNQLDFFPQSQGIDVATNVRCGIPYKEILEEGKEKEIDLIVIASLGKTGIAKYLIGGVARNVLKGSECPVLLTK